MKKNLMFYNVTPMPHSVLLHSELIKSGFFVDFWYIKESSSIYPWRNIENITVNKVFSWKLSCIKLLLHDFKKADFLVISGWPTYSHVILIFLSFICRKKFALWIDIHTNKVSTIKKIRNNFLLKLASFLFVTGDFGVKYYIDKLHFKENKIRNFPYLSANVDIKKVINANFERLNAIRNNEKIKLLISNRFIERKGYGVVCEALSILEKSVLYRIDITILGVGDEYSYYKNKLNMITPYIKFWGWVEYDEYLDFVYNCDIFLHASLNEPYGIPPVDAMSCGKLVICSDGVVSGLSLIKNKETGFIYEKNNSKKLADIFEMIVQNPDLIYILGKNAQLHVKDYAASYNVKQIKEVLFPQKPL